MRTAALVLVLAASVAISPPAAAQVVVAARPIARGAMIGPDDVALENPRISPADALVSAAAVIGQEAVRAIGRGAPIRAGAVAPPNAARRGGALILRAAGPGFAVEAPGVAKADARVGGMAVAVNELSGRTVRGRVGPDGILVVDP